MSSRIHDETHVDLLFRARSRTRLSHAVEVRNKGSEQRDGKLARSARPHPAPAPHPQLRCDLGLVPVNLLDEALRVLAADEHLELDAEREVGREGVIDHGVDDRGATLLELVGGTLVPAAAMEVGRRSPSTWTFSRSELVGRTGSCSAMDEAGRGKEE